MLGAGRLGYDLTKDHNQERRAKGSVHTRHHVAQEQRGHRVDQHVPEQNGAEQKVASLAQRINVRGVLLFAWCAYLLEYFQLTQIERHETQVEAAEQTAKREEHKEEEDASPCGHHIARGYYGEPIVGALVREVFERVVFAVGGVELLHAHVERLRRIGQYDVVELGLVHVGRCVVHDFEGPVVA